MAIHPHLRPKAAVCLLLWATCIDLILSDD
jgi:hypothetical protein